MQSYANNVLYEQNAFDTHGMHTRTVRITRDADSVKESRIRIGSFWLELCCNEAMLQRGYSAVY